jgi:hypothetical protein
MACKQRSFQLMHSIDGPGPNGQPVRKNETKRDVVANAHWLVGSSASAVGEVDVSGVPVRARRSPMTKIAIFFDTPEPSARCSQLSGN